MLERIWKMQKDEDGFTLIELMVVVLIIAILIAIAIPTFLGLRRRAQDRSAQSDLRNGLTAAKAFYTDDDSYTNFDAAEGTDIEPSLDWVDGAAPAEGEVGVALASGNEVVLVTESASAAEFCIADDGTGATARGSEAVATYALCLASDQW
jgi:type IV pilus assembly protein PilA